MKTENLLKRSTVMLTLAGVLSFAPYHLAFDAGTGLVVLDPALAFAKGGDDDDGDDGGDDNGGDRDDRDDRDDDDDDRDDDRSGRGGDDDDDGDGDDRRGRGSDDANEATLSDGSRIEIENGRFELKNPSGRTIVERRATAADYDLLNQAKAGTTLSLRQAAPQAGSAPQRNGKRGGGVVSKLEVGGANIEITYTDGWKEEIENGRYELKDAQNRTVIERPARDADRQRLFSAVR